MTSRLTAVAVLVAETVALATTPPDGSVTVPETVAPVTCACATAPVIKVKNNVNNTAKIVVTFVDFDTPMHCLLEDPSWVIACNPELKSCPDF